MSKKIKLQVSQDDCSDPEDLDDSEVAYLQLPKHPGQEVYGIVKKQLRLSELVEGYKGPDIYLDFDKENELIGMEILT